MFTTLNDIRSKSPCESGWQTLLKSLNKTKADDEPVSFEFILDSNGLDDALWCCRAAPQYDREWRLFAVWCAKQVQYLNTDQRVTYAINIAEKFANGEATFEQLVGANDAAHDAALDGANDAASYAASAAANATRDASWNAASAAVVSASAAVSAAAWAANAAASAARAAWAASDYAHANRAKMFKRLCIEGISALNGIIYYK